MTSFFDSKDFNRRRAFLPSNSPDPIVCDGSFYDYRDLVIDDRRWIVALQSSRLAAKLIHMLPSQVPFPLLLTVLGIEAVSISSIRFKKPSGVRNPTMIFGTPSRKDWIQNFISFLSRLIISRSFRMSAVVLSSIQLIGLSSVGFESQTRSL